MTGTADVGLLSTSLTTGDGAVPTVVAADGVWFTLADGRRVIDASNTAAPLGHSHPRMADALRSAIAAPILNEGWGWSDRDRAAEELAGIAFQGEDWVGAVRFFISASEANDAALSLAQALTGRRALATRERAYHGGVGLAREVTVQPQWHGGLSSTGGIRPAPSLADIRVLPAPTSARVTGQPDPTANDQWHDAARQDLASCAAVIIDYSQGGIYHNASYQDQVAALARESGALWIADETVTGFGRVGGWFQFQHGDSRPDMVTMGKSLAAGGSAAGALVVSRDVLRELQGSSWQSYSTFRGHPMAIAAVRAHLRVAGEGGHIDRAANLDHVVRDGLTKLAAAHPSVARVDGRGLHWTVEVHGPDWRQWRGQEADPLASRIVARALEANVLLSTSAEQTSVFIAPPLVIQESELNLIFDALDRALEIADDEYEGEEQS